MNYKKIETVKDLKEFIENLPDNTRILSYKHGMEQIGYFHPTCALENFIEETRHTFDSFDYTEYDYTCFCRAKDGNLCLTIDV